MESKRLYSPILEGLLSFQKEHPARFHIPGHKGGVYTSLASKEYFRSILEIDVTEVTGLDDLHHPQGMIAEAQRLAAQCFHAEQTYFLVNGSTAGNMAMLLATLERGNQVLVQRNCHKSVFHALSLIEAEAILIEPFICSQFYVPVGLSADDVHDALEQYPHAKAIILTSPNYYGMISPTVAEIIRLVQKKGCAVLIDEAHGAHFGQYSELPQSAMQMGADACVQSTHKMLSSLTMSSMLHRQGNRIDPADLEYYLRSLQSSSPSYPLLASLDLARAHLEQHTEQEWAGMVGQTVKLRETLQEIPGYHFSSLEARDGRYTSDPFKLTIQPRWELSGYELQELLEQKGIFVELADPYNLLLTLPLVAEPSWNEKLVQTLADIARVSYKQGSRKRSVNLSIRSTEAKMKIKSLPIRKYKRKELESIALEQAVGRRVAEMILPYPPGIPICLPNETMSEQMLTEILELQQKGAYFQGKPSDFKTILVVKH